MPKHILVLGAGKSSASLIKYLLDRAETHDWQITVGDLDESTAQRKVEGFERGRAIAFDVFDERVKNAAIAAADLVVSLLPPAFHDHVARACLQHGKSMVTASYVSPIIRQMSAAFAEKGLIFMGEIGLDPGIDHLAIVELRDRLQEQGSTLKKVASYTGALIAPESDTNPWHYKFSWAPMNVVKAGQGISQYLFEGKPKYIPYNRLFSAYIERAVAGAGAFEIYPNRDSMAYIEKYDLHGVDTFMRGTMRYRGYCDGWNAFVKLGWTDDSYRIPIGEAMTYTDLLRAFLPIKSLTGRSLRAATAHYLNIDEAGEVMAQLAFLDLFDERKIDFDKPAATPAELLLHLLIPKWKLEAGDRDMVVMMHEIEHERAGRRYRLTSSMVCKGNENGDTAIAQTVGLPLGIMVKLIATGRLNDFRGVQIPLMPEAYQPILQELATDFGIGFREVEEELTTQATAP